MFASADERRKRVVRLVGRLAAGLTALWLVALFAGAVGLGELPGVSLPRTAADDDAGKPAAAPAGRAAEPSRRAAPTRSRREAAARRSRRRAASERPASQGAAPGAFARPKAGSRNTPGGARGYPPSSTGAPPAPAASAPPASPARPARPTETPGRGPHSGGPPDHVDPPGAGQAQPSPTGAEHSNRWRSDGG